MKDNIIDKLDNKLDELNNKLTKIDNKYVLAGIFIVYLITTLFLVLRHEIWGDEGQAWQIAKTLSTLDIIKQMKYEGHSCLWHLILSIPAKLGLTSISMNLTSWAFVSSAVLIFLFKSKWNIFTKILVIFSPSFLYYLPAISRCYCLIPLCLVLFVIVYDKRHEHPYLYATIIGFTAHTHIIMFGFVGIVSLMFMIEYLKDFKNINKKEFIGSFLILFAFFISLAIQIIPSIGTCSLVRELNLASIKYVLEGIINYLIGTKTIISGLPFFIHIIILLLVLIPVIFLLSKYTKKIALTLIAFMMGFIIIHLFWGYTTENRVAIFFTVLIFLGMRYKNFTLETFICSISILLLTASYNNIIYDINHDFSDSKNTADYINKNVEDKSLIIFLNSSSPVSVIAQIEKDVSYYNLPLGKAEEFILWSKKKRRDFSDQEIKEKLVELSQKYEHIYVLSSRIPSIDPGNEYTYNILAKSQKIVPLYQTNIEQCHGESFSLFKYTKDY